MNPEQQIEVIKKYKYYQREFGEYYHEIYRIPDNGKDYSDNFGLIEHYQGNGLWDKNGVGVLIDESSTGYFSFKDDEITDQSEIDKIIKKIDSKVDIKK